MRAADAVPACLSASALADALPCGAEIEQLVAQIADTEPPANPAHQARCPYCQATLRRLGDAWEDVHTLATQPVPIPPTLTAQIMARVRILARHATDSILLGHPAEKPASATPSWAA